MIRVTKWLVSGQARGHARPVSMFRLPDRTMRVIYSDGSGIKLACWSCAIRGLGLDVVGGPWTMLAPETFGR